MLNTIAIAWDLEGYGPICVFLDRIELGEFTIRMHSHDQTVEAIQAVVPFDVERKLLEDMLTTSHVMLVHGG